MPRIFNSIRQRLLKENRLTRYLVYAIGEILLVVIGILIAVNINDWNADRKQQREIQQLLTVFEKDLVANTKNCTYILEWVTSRDSICEVIMQGKATREMYEAKTLRPMFTNYNVVSINKENLDRLLAKEELMGPGPMPLLELLKNYKEHIEREAITAERFRAYVYDQNMYLTDNATWYSAYVDSSSDEAIDYFLNDPIYRNKTHFYQTMITHNFGRSVASRRNTELALFHQLLELQGITSKEELQTEFRQLGFAPNEALECTTEVDLQDHRTKGFAPFILNTGADTLKVMIRSIRGKTARTDSTSIPPGGHLVASSYLNQYFDVSRNGRCIGRFLPDATGYAILGNTE
jgi:hypothetical protein